MIFWIPLLIGLTSSVCGVFAVKWKLYEAKEEDNITITWDVQENTDLSLINLLCFLQSKTAKVFYHVIRGVEDPDALHQQFAGRVQCQRDALRRGQVQLHVSRVTPEDSGQYRCDLAVSDGKSMKRWLLEAKEHFLLNVTSHVFPTTLDSTAAGRPDQSHHSRNLVGVAGGLCGGLVVVAGLMLLFHAALGCFQEGGESDINIANV